MSKHTPAPWGYDYEPGYCGELIAPDGTTVARFAGEPSPMDAALIAAAPELLEALKDARRKLAWFTDSYPQDIVVSESEFFGPIDAAIAKATGEQA